MVHIVLRVGLGLGGKIIIAQMDDHRVGDPLGEIPMALSVPAKGPVIQRREGIG